MRYLHAIIILWAFLCNPWILQAQSPPAFNYQAMAVNSANHPIMNKEIQVRMSILEGSSSGAVVFREIHVPTTSDLGVFTVKIGEGTLISGDFSSINWAAHSYWLKVEADFNGGTDYRLLGVNQFVSVPYALHAQTATEVDDADADPGNELQNLSISGNTLSISNGNSVTLPSGGSGATKLNDLSDGKSDNDGTDNGSSIFLGVDAGLNDDQSDNKNVGIGYKSLYHNTTGNYNTANGNLALYYNKAGSRSTAIGYGAMYYANNSSTAFDANNVAVGYQALEGSTTPADNTGKSNTAIGVNALRYNTSGGSNTATGRAALFSNTGGYRNTATGRSTLEKNISGKSNTATGYRALYSNTTGDYNTANGYSTLYSNTTGSSNVAQGRAALYSNTTGHSNIAIGIAALYKNTDRSNLVAVGDSALYHNGEGTIYSSDATNNTAIGSKALYSNTTGERNTATGFESLFSNTTGGYNTANGYQALYSNTKGNYNTANGIYSLYSNTKGLYNSANGFQALYFNTTGEANTANGYRALTDNTTGSCNTATGLGALIANKTGDYNTALGYSAHSNRGNYSNSMGLGYDADPSASNRVHVGNSSITWIGGQANWSTYSDRRIKRDIVEDVRGLDFITRLRPVTYHIDKDAEDALLGTIDSSEYEGKYEIETVKQSGFIAQEVEEAARAAGYDFSGIDIPKGDTKLYSLSYAEFVVPLVKAIQEQQTVIKDYEKQIESLKQQQAKTDAKIDKLESYLYNMSKR